MSLLLRLLSAVLLGAGLYLVAGRLLYLPSARTRDAIRYPHGKPSFEEQAARLLRPVTALLEKLFPMSEYRRQRYGADFAAWASPSPRRNTWLAKWPEACPLPSWGLRLSRSGSHGWAF